MLLVLSLLQLNLLRGRLRRLLLLPGGRVVARKKVRLRRTSRALEERRRHGESLIDCVRPLLAAGGRAVSETLQRDRRAFLPRRREALGVSRKSAAVGCLRKRVVGVGLGGLLLLLLLLRGVQQVTGVGAGCLGRGRFSQSSSGFRVGCLRGSLRRHP